MSFVILTESLMKRLAFRASCVECGWRAGLIKFLGGTAKWGYVCSACADRLHYDTYMYRGWRDQ